MPAWISAETILALVALACALMPALMMLANGWYFRRAEEPDNGEMPEVTVCVPARNEVERIGLTLEALRRQTQVRLTVLVGDDHSTDGTAELVEKVSAEDSRVQLVSVPGLPAGWSGKQHALNHLAGLAITPWVAFLDADVSLAPGALSRLVTCARQRKLDLVSGFPRQVTRSWGEALLIPHIQFILLGFLPFFMARAWNHPAFAAGCGQLFLARRESYLRAGGHALIKASFHDGLHLPRAFRREGLRTGAIDGSDLADCRMYAGFSETWAGLSKNATDGMAAPGAIIPFTVLLGLGQVLPAAMLALGAGGSGMWALALAVSLVHHTSLALRFRQSLRGALLHPLGILLLLALQWTALLRSLTGLASAEWRGRSYPSAEPPAGKAS